ncbi:MAG: hypothetical protein U1E65_19535 [Myxococcota bacterium]
MVNPVASGSSPRYVEMGRTFSGESDGGRNLELSMAATVFRDLQSAGYISSSARLADAPPSGASGTASGLRGTSYEARLVELIRDRDGNGKLDIDMDRLRDSGLLSRSATPEQLESAISGRPRDALSDTFLNNQDRKSGLNDYNVSPNARGRTVQGYSRGMVLNGTQDRQNETYAASLPGRVSQSPEEARRVANEAIAGAQALTGRGDQRNAQDLLVRSGDALQNAGRLDDARRVFRELQNPPYRDTQTNLVQDRLDQVRRTTPGFDEARHVIPVDSPHAHSTIHATDYRSTYGGLADRRLAQIDQTQEMQRLTGQASIDPRNMDQVRDYFQRYAAGEGGHPRSTEEVRGEYQRYMQNFYAHSGDGVEWTSSIPQDQRPGRMTEILADQPRDASGRTIVDCEGYTYMSRSILGGINAADGHPRFAVMFAERPGHVTTGVFDRLSGQGFSQNNGDMTMFDRNFIVPSGPRRRGAPDPGGHFDVEAMGQATAHSIATNHYNVVGLGMTPSAADTMDDGTPPLPRVGRFLYDGDRVIGTVTPEFRANYEAWTRTQLNPTVSGYLASLDR